MNAKEGSELCENCKLEDLHRNYGLIKTDCFSLFNEFLEMGTDVENMLGDAIVILFLCVCVFVSRTGYYWCLLRQ